MHGDSPNTGSTSRGLVLLERIGEGGFGEVFRARLETAGGLTRHVAVKLLRGDAVDESMIARMADEAHLLAALQHPVVLDIEDLVQVDGRSAIISEFVDGFDLGEVLPIPAGAAVGIVARVAEALHSAWASPGPDGEPMRIVHRDIKPSNIRIGRGGVVKLLDFGIARAGTGQRRVKTATGVVIGSLGYFAPERWSGDEDGHESDVYALGCVLFEAITARPALRDLTAAHQIGLAHDEASHRHHLDSLLGACPEDADLRALIASMMAFAPADRPSAAEVAVSAHRLAGRLPGDLFSWSNRLGSRTDPSWSSAVGRRLFEGAGGFTAEEPPAAPPPLGPPPAGPPDAPSATPPVRAEPPAASPTPPPRRRGTTALVALAGGLLAVGGAVAAVALIVGLGAWASGWLDTVAEAPVAALDQPGADPADADPAPPPGALVDDDPTAEVDPTTEDVAIADVDGPDPIAADDDAAPTPDAPSHRASPVLVASEIDAGTDADSEAEPGGVAPPTPAPTPPLALRVPLTVLGGVPVRLRNERGTVAIDAATPGAYTLQASFADDVWRDVGSVTLTAGAPQVVRCVSRFRRCSVEPE